MLLSETLPLNVRIILSDPFPDGPSFYVTCVCSHCCWANQNHSKTSLTCYVSCISDAFSSCCVSFYLINQNCFHSTNYFYSVMSLTMTGLDPGPMVPALFYFALVNRLVLLANPLVMFVTQALMFWFRLETIQLVKLSRCFCSYSKESSTKVVTSQHYVGAQNIYFPPSFKSVLELLFCSGLVQLILAAVALPIRLQGGRQLDTLVGLPIIVVGMLKDLSSSDMRTDEIPRFMKFGLLVRTASRVKFTQQLKQTSVLELLKSSRPITLMKVAIESLFSEEFPIMEV